MLNSEGLRKLSRLKAGFSDLALTGRLTAEDMGSPAGRVRVSKLALGGAGLGALAGGIKGLLTESDGKGLAKNIAAGAGIGAGIGLAGAAGKAAMPHIKSGRAGRYTTALQRGASKLDPEGYSYARDYSNEATQAAREIYGQHEQGLLPKDYTVNILSMLGEQKAMADAYRANLKHQVLGSSRMLRNIGASLLR